jgi:ABC-type nitrate/sulfonate/bicarbonate transport system ATPase subunit
MALLDDILAWSHALPGWQRDALRRLFQKHDLDAGDFDDLYAMLKASYGIADPGNRTPVPLAKDHLPTQAGAASAIVLKEMHSLQNVNRIAAGQKLPFAPAGLTVIYGGNGSGKSGYSRVLKKACRARDASDDVLPDVSDAVGAKLIPEAKFILEVGGAAKEIHWRRGAGPGADEMAAIAVFDALCARAYLDDEQDVAYLPYGLDIVENLGRKVLPQVERRLLQELASINVDASPFAHLLGPTAVGAQVAALSEKSDPEQFRRLGTLDEAVQTRLAQVRLALKEADPSARARATRLTIQRLEGLQQRMTTSTAWVTDDAVAKLRGMDDETEAANKAERMAAEKMRAGEDLLPGTGDAVWRLLFESARRFSTELAYPKHHFPHTGPGSKCVLCQQDASSEEAAERLKRFATFVGEDASRVAQERRSRQGMAIPKIREARLGFGMDAAMREELEEMAPGLLEDLAAYERLVAERRAAMLDAAGKTHDWTKIPPLEGDPRGRLTGLIGQLRQHAEDLDKAAAEAQRPALEKEHAELDARERLGKGLKALLALLERLQRKAAVAKCQGELKTKGISDKAREFGEVAVTEALRTALNEEFKALGVGHIRTRLEARVQQTQMFHKLVLDLPSAAKLSAVLSDGEQRAIAIGSFLAELQQAGHSGAIIFDDPVSSLDHNLRQHVARRLVHEAQKRQVVIFTHDTSFLGELRDEIDHSKTAHVIHHLEWKDNRSGVVTTGLPWEHQGYKERLDNHRRAQRAMAKTWQPYPNGVQVSAMRDEYSRLRATMERVIQDVVFNGVIVRYRDWVKAGNLKGVAGLEAQECSDLSRIYDRCHGIVTAHDPASAKGPSVPTPDELLKDLDGVQVVIDAINARRKAAAPAAPVAAAGP